MRNAITIPPAIADELRRHFFQNDLEQGAFLFARPETDAAGLRLVVENFYLVPPSGWEIQMEVYLEMRDSERAKIMKLARDKKLSAIDCHSHPHSGDDVCFSVSDVAGINEFAQYAKWKLDGKPFAAMVWGEASVDAIIWQGDFIHAERVDEVVIAGASPVMMVSTGSWFRSARSKHRFRTYE